MHAFLIVGSTNQKRQEEIQHLLDRWHVLAADIVELVAESEHITIDQVRGFQKRLLFVPMLSPYTVGLIRCAATLTIEAQQALLKILEEPPPHVYMICEAESADQLAPTIVSRCQIIRISEERQIYSHQDIAVSTITSLLTKEPQAIWSEVDKHEKDRREAKQWIRELLLAARFMLISYYRQQGDYPDGKKITTLIRRLQRAQNQLAVNCNTKLVLDRIGIHL